MQTSVGILFEHEHSFNADDRRLCANDGKLLSNGKVELGLTFPFVRRLSQTVCETRR